MPMARSWVSSLQGLLPELQLWTNKRVKCVNSPETHACHQVTGCESSPEHACAPPDPWLPAPPLGQPPFLSALLEAAANGWAWCSCTVLLVYSEPFPFPHKIRAILKTTPATFIASFTTSLRKQRKVGGDCLHFPLPL